MPVCRNTFSQHNRLYTLLQILMNMCTRECKSVDSMLLAKFWTKCRDLFSIRPFAFKLFLIIISLTCKTIFDLNDSQVPVPQHCQSNKVVISSASTLDAIFRTSNVKVSFQEATPSSLDIAYYLKKFHCMYIF